jgi:fucose 4-O-acetylase-like acetyltransferase
VNLAGRTIDTSAGRSFAVDFIQDFVSRGFAAVIVPLFFLMSGYLFFAGFDWSRESYYAKVKTRIRTLLVPFLFWNAITLLAVVLGQIAPITRSYYSGHHSLIASHGVYECLDCILGIDKGPIAYQFWFVRDLMLLVLLAPVVHLIHKTVPRLFLASMFGLWLFNAWPIRIPSGTAVLFFYAGSLLSVRQVSIFASDKYGALAIPCYLAALVLDTWSQTWDYNVYLHNAGALLGVLSALYVTRHLAETGTWKLALLWLGGASFFVYAAHWLPLLAMQKSIYPLLDPRSSVAALMSYLLMPAMTIALSIAVYYGLLRVTPGFLAVVTGGRCTERRKSLAGGEGRMGLRGFAAPAVKVDNHPCRHRESLSRDHACAS